MTTTIRLTYDGEVFRPHGPVPLPANTEVDATIESPPCLEEKTGKPYCSLDVAMSLNLEGPPDWSKRWEEYLYGGWDDREE